MSMLRKIMLTNRSSKVDCQTFRRTDCGLGFAPPAASHPQSVVGSGRTAAMMRAMDLIRA